MRDDAQADAVQHLFPAHRELDERVRLRVGRVLDRRAPPRVAQHLVDEDPADARIEQKRRVANELDLHAARPSSTQPLWPPRPIAFESATSTRASRASFGT